MAVCPSCPRSWGSEQTLAAHLIDAHGLTAPEAVNRARATFHEAAKMDRKVIKQKGAQHEPAEAQAHEEAEARAMSPKARRCRVCKKTGHRSNKCPQGAGREAPRTRRRGGRQSFASALDQLRGERTELDAAIAALERLEARG